MSTLETLRDMPVNSTIEVKNIGWRANNIVNSIYNLSKCSSQEYLVDGKDGMILVKRIK